MGDTHEQLALVCMVLVPLGWIAAEMYWRLAIRVRLLAHPNHRSAHVSSTPTGAGLAFILVWLIGVAFLDLWSVALLAAVGAGLIGFCDDVRSLPVTIRAIGYATCSVIAVLAIGFPTLNLAGHLVDLGWMGLLFGGLSLLWLQNLYNFMDGMDGIAISEAVFVLAGVMMIGGISMLPLLLLCACLGFLVVNWPPAKVFMGDAGASFLGLLMGVFALMEVSVSVWVWMILLAVFTSDACLTIVTRGLRRERIYEAHHLHAYQHLMRRFGARQTLYVVWSINLFWLLPLALLADRFPDLSLYLLISAVLPLLVAEFLSGAGNLEPRLDVIKTGGR